MACSGPSPKAAPASTKKVVPLESSVQAGRYGITGQPVTDHCDGSLTLAAKEILIEPKDGLFRADVVNRDYDLEVRGDMLVATGRFDSIDGCGTHQYIEIWRLRPHGPDRLEGQLTTYYRGSAPRDCLRACKFVTAIKAVRAGEKSESPPR